MTQENSQQFSDETLRQATETVLSYFDFLLSSTFGSSVFSATFSAIFSGLSSYLTQIITQYTAKSRNNAKSV